MTSCVYGSCDCPQVWTLRHFRELYPCPKRAGQAFICAYYALGPAVAKRFDKRAWFEQVGKGLLYGMVRRLNESGVENTLYDDRKW